MQAKCPSEWAQYPHAEGWWSAHVPASARGSARPRVDRSLSRLGGDCGKDALGSGTCKPILTRCPNAALLFETQESAFPNRMGKQALIRCSRIQRDLRFCQYSAACLCGTSAEATSPSRPGTHCGREMEGAIARRTWKGKRGSGEHCPGHRKGPSTPSSLHRTCMSNLPAFAPHGPLTAGELREVARRGRQA